jgi:hypothetical protein
MSPQSSGKQEEKETHDWVTPDRKKSNLIKPQTLAARSTPSKPKSVSFQDTVTFREVCPRKFIEPEEIRDVWYSDEEYSKIKKVVKATVKKSEKGEAVEETKGITMRGLEGRTKFGARRRKNNKAAALEAVWETQIELWKNRLNQPSMIAAAYRPHSTHAKFFARQSAHADALYVTQNIRSES